MNHCLRLLPCLLLLVCHPSLAQEQVEFDTALLTTVNDTILASDAPGVVRDVAIQAGQDVVAADIIVALNKDEYQAELEVKLSEKAVAEIEATNDADVEFAEKSFEVNQRLLFRSRQAREQYAKSVSQTDMDRLQLELQQTQLSKRQACLQLDIAKETTKVKSNEVDVARLRLANRDIKAPIDGRIEQIFVQKGQWVNAGSPIARIVDLKKLRVKAIFPVEHYLKIKKGNSAKFAYEIGEDGFEVKGIVTYVNSVVRDNVFQVWVDIDNSDLKLIPGAQGKLSVELSSTELKLD